MVVIEGQNEYHPNKKPYDLIGKRRRLICFPKQFSFCLSLFDIGELIRPIDEKISEPNVRKAKVSYKDGVNRYPKYSVILSNVHR